MSSMSLPGFPKKGAKKAVTISDQVEYSHEGRSFGVFQKKYEAPIGFYRERDKYFHLKKLYAHDESKFKIIREMWHARTRYQLRKRLRWPPKFLWGSLFWTNGYYDDFWRKSHAKKLRGIHGEWETVQDFEAADIDSSDNEEIENYEDVDIIYDPPLPVKKLSWNTIQKRYKQWKSDMADRRRKNPIHMHMSDACTLETEEYRQELDSVDSEDPYEADARRHGVNEEQVKKNRKSPPESSTDQDSLATENSELSIITVGPLEVNDETQDTKNSKDEMEQTTLIFKPESGSTINPIDFDTTRNNDSNSKRTKKKKKKGKSKKRKKEKIDKTAIISPTPSESGSTTSVVSVSAQSIDTTRRKDPKLPKKERKKSPEDTSKSSKKDQTEKPGILTSTNTRNSNDPKNPEEERIKGSEDNPKSFDQVKLLEKNARISPIESESESSASIVEPYKQDGNETKKSERERRNRSNDENRARNPGPDYQQAIMESESSASIVEPYKQEGNETKKSERERRNRSNDENRARNPGPDYQQAIMESKSNSSITSLTSISSLGSRRDKKSQNLNEEKLKAPENRRESSVKDKVREALREDSDSPLQSPAESITSILSFGKKRSKESKKTDETFRRRLYGHEDQSNNKQTATRTSITSITSLDKESKRKESETYPLVESPKATKSGPITLLDQAQFDMKKDRKSKAEAKEKKEKKDKDDKSKDRKQKRKTSGGAMAIILVSNEGSKAFLKAFNPDNTIELTKPKKKKAKEKESKSKK